MSWKIKVVLCNSLYSRTRLAISTIYEIGQSYFLFDIYRIVIDSIILKFIFLINVQFSKIYN